MKKRLGSLLLALVLVLGMLPATAWADNTCTVRVYAATQDLTFQTSGGTAVTPEVDESGLYQVYTLKDVAVGTYNYTSGQYGTGVLKLEKDEEIYLRVVDFTLKQGESAFTMKMTLEEDTELVYTSPRTSGLSTQLLVPVLGWSHTYRYDLLPEEGWCAYHGQIWVIDGEGPLQGFKNGGYNLSDSGYFTVGRETEVTFKVPAGAKLGVYALVRFYSTPVEFDIVKTGAEGEYDVYQATVPSSFGGNLYYTVSMAGCVTTSVVFEANTASITVNPSAIAGDPHGQHLDSREASLLSNGNRAKFLPLQIGEEFAIWTSRTWQAINDTMSNRYVEPDKHYYVISGDAVTVDQLGTVTGVKEGTAIVAMTYDAMKYEGNVYSAVDSDSIAVFAFTVGKSSEGITTGLLDCTDLDTHYVAATVTMDGSTQPVATNASTPYTFTPTDARGETIGVRVCTVYGYPTPAVTHEWESYQANGDGSFTIDLYPGRNVVEITAGDRVAYHVLNCKATNIAITNDSAPGETPKQDESVTIRFDGIITPLPKLGAIYNPGFGGTVYLEGTLTAPNGDTKTVTSEGVQYNLGDTAAISVPLEQSGGYQLTGIRIHSGAFGSSPGTHLTLSRQSDGGSYSGGNAPENAGYYSYLPSLSFQAESADHEATAAAVRALIADIGQVELTEVCKGKIDTARRAYDAASSAVRALITEEQLKVLTDAENAYKTLDEKHIEDNIQTRVMDDKTYYILTDADELNWFVNKVNGTLASGSTAATDVNAVLGNDITVNEAVLGDEYQLMSQTAEQWTPIKSFSGIFDGDGHSINGIYHVSDTASQAGVFLNNSGTIRNLTVGDSYLQLSTTGNVRIGGIVATNETSGLIEHVIYRGYVGALSTSSNTSVGGIVETNRGAIRLSQTEGKVASGSRAGGIAGVSTGTDSLLESCILKGTVTGDQAGGIVEAASGTVSNCYTAPEARIQGNKGAAGIAYDLSDGTIASCYNTAPVTANGEASGVYSEAESLYVTVGSPSYYLYGTAAGGVISGSVERKTAAQFASGEVAYLLGSGFGQEIGSDAYPVFFDGGNAVFQVGGGYANSSAETTVALIDAIGTVSVDGSAGCFSAVILAKRAYDGLTEAEQSNVTNAASLTRKLNDYDTAVTGLNDMLTALETIDESSGPAIEAAKTAYLGYVERGGDESRITGVGNIQTAEETFFQYKEAAIGAGIQTRTVDGKDYYVLTDADELYWFARLVNGTLQDSAGAVPMANALLGSDIVVNENLLDTILPDGVNVNEKRAALQRQWTPIQTFSGVFDGQGHAISGLYMNGGTDGGLFGTVTDAAVRNLSVQDTYFAASLVGGIVHSLNSGTVEGCSFEGMLLGMMRAGGIVMYANGGSIENCYARGKLYITKYISGGQSFQGAIAGMANVPIKNCYGVCDYGTLGDVGGLVGFGGGKKLSLENCYFEASDRVASAIGTNRDNIDTSGAAACTQERFATGEIAYHLGKAFGQDLSSDVYPVFNNGVNSVYYVNGGYANRSLQAVKTMIDTIGTVALDGGENCFLRAAEAQQAFDDLSPSMQSAIGPSYRSKLQQATDSYAEIVAAMEAEITALKPFNKTDRDSKYNALAAKLEQYIQRGGDTSRISNYGGLPALKSELDETLIRWVQEDTEAAIQIRDVEGAEYYILASQNDLEWFLALVNGTLLTETDQNAAANAVLDADIVLNSDLVKTIVAGSGIDAGQAASAYASTGVTGSYGGCFDGAGHTVSGLYLPTGSLFGTLADGAVIKNVTLSDTVIQKGNGGFAKTMSSGAKVINCNFDGTLMNSTQNTGGIAGEVQSGAAVEDCMVSGMISTTMRLTGGITGKNSGSILRCGSTAAVASSGMLPSLGGIVGQNAAGGSISDCYSRGLITGTHNMSQKVAGIAGENLGTLINCYSAGIISTKNTINCGAVAGTNSGTVKNCYYLEGSAGASLKGIGKIEDVAGTVASRTSDQFADGTVATALGAAFVQHGSYPEIKGHIPTYTLTVVNGTDVTDAGPYTSGTAVAIKADAAPSGQVFDGWTADMEDITFAGASSTETTVTMPDANLTVTANYKTTGGGNTPGETFDGYVTVSFEDNAVRVNGESGVQYSDAFGTIVNQTEVGYHNGESIADVTLRLLKERNISFTNSGSADTGFYLQSIGNFTVGGQTIPKLGEMDCGAGSGWMVTWNNWFINQGASEFEVENGDVIKWKYTCQYGKDIGHDWDNPTAEITGLTFQQNYGTLSPSFREDVTSYVYTVPKSVRSICLEAVQANYWARVTYTANGTAYRPMQAIPVSNGTVIALESAYYKNYTDAAPVDTDRLTITIQVEGQETVEPEPEAMPFTDVADHWALEAIRYAYEHKLMDGMGNNTFAPNSTLNRAMLVTLLYRLEGTPSVTGGHSFTDVANGEWYADAVAWANANGIVSGMGAQTFAPTVDITREQMATMLYNYAKYKGYDTTEGGMALKEYGDYESISGWAQDALGWAHAAGLVTGRTESAIVPGGTATRAEAATILMRFLETIVK